MMISCLYSELCFGLVWILLLMGNFRDFYKFELIYLIWQILIYIGNHLVNLHYDWNLNIEIYKHNNSI